MGGHLLCIQVKGATEKGQQVLRKMCAQRRDFTAISGSKTQAPLRAKASLDKAFPDHPFRRGRCPSDQDWINATTEASHWKRTCPEIFRERHALLPGCGRGRQGSQHTSHYRWAN